MLEVKNLCKTYKPKKGEPVQALKNVSTTFGETGMVFILGKSGCGKSTFLNCIGGLDKFDSGEIIIKGKSSTEFSGSDFDSYRNTLVGFIFQEYNILNEFNVEKNIALALELQGKRATREKVDELLREVDLADHAKRKPNELSGGQKQRIAIARALIKDPEIIIADEPTGALDSATGTQVFETLQKLAKSRLVIIVSHDREFAELYGDRIIEMKDGVIISDETKRIIPPKELSEGFNVVGNELIHIEPGHTLTEKESAVILALVKSGKSDVVVSVNKKNNDDFKKIAKIQDNGSAEKFDTSTTEDLSVKKYDGKQLKLIRSKMKYGDALKMGASGLKSKPIRLVFTILLCLVAFTLFGLTDTMASYNKNKVATQSLIDSKVSYLSFVRQEKRSYDSDESFYYQSTNIGAEDIAKISSDLDITFYPVFSGESASISFDGLKSYTSSGYFTSSFAGYISLTRSQVEALGYTVTAASTTDWVTADDEIAITEYVFESFQKYGYKDPTDSMNIVEGSALLSPSQMLGKKISLNSSVYTIKAVVDTKLDSDRYKKLKEETTSGNMDASDYMLYSEFENIRNYSFHGLAYISSTKFDSLISEENESIGLDYSSKYYIQVNNVGTGSYWYSAQKITDLTTSGSNHKFFTSGKTSLGENEYLISLKQLIEYANQTDGQSALVNAYNSAVTQYVDSSSVSEADANIRASQEMTFLNNSTNLNMLTSFANSLSFEITVNESYGSATSTNSFVIAGVYAADSNFYTNSYGSYRQEEILVVSDDMYDEMAAEIGTEGIYKYAIASMPESEAGITKVVNYHYANMDSSKKYIFTMVNEVSSILDMVAELIQTLSKVFLYIGIGFAVFASLMMMNFISTSISYKKREIGILRAVGARSKDVFTIFFNESLIIALINFVLALAATITTVLLLNNMLRTQYGVLITILNFGIRQVGLMLAISILVAIVASALPVFNISRKKPIDAINNR